MPQVGRKTRQVGELTHNSINANLNQFLEPVTPIPINKPYVPKPFIMNLPLNLSTLNNTELAENFEEIMHMIYKYYDKMNIAFDLR